MPFFAERKSNKCCDAKSYVTKAKPEWQDTRPKDEEQRDYYATADDNLGKFTFAWREALSTLSEIKMTPQKVAGVVRTQPTALKAARRLVLDEVEVWDKFADRIGVAYLIIIKAAFEEEVERRGFLVVEKALTPEEIRFKKLKKAFTVDNPYTRKRIRKIKTARSKYFQDEVLRRYRNVLGDVYSGDKTASQATVIMNEMQFEIQERHEKVVERKSGELFDELVSSGIEGDVAVLRVQAYAKRETERFRKYRADSISRTESVEAYNSGLVDSWEVAKDEGIIPAKTKKVWIAATGSDRTCVICQGLDGESVATDKAFSTGITQPPAHIMCRCTMGLEFDV